MTRRTERIAEQLRGEIARILREDVADPRVQLVTLTRVDVAPDLSHALVYWSHLNATPERSPASEEELLPLEEGLASAAPFVRRQAAHHLDLRRMPELRFRHDPSLELGTRTLSLLRQLSDDEKA
ncbi:MAG: 30S ribosome-binding factor RbfA [Proteobacteria bacterium]|nr:30S ribosome-binding factor RbfA [Pseudomonadota bacterium]